MSASHHPAVEARQAFLDRAAQAEGSAWGDVVARDLSRQNRRLTGGWPGTLTEARFRVARRIFADLGPGFGATQQELEQAARAAYKCARDRWHESCDAADVAAGDDDGE